MSRSIRQALIDRDHHQLSLVRQCSLLNVSRALVPGGLPQPLFWSIALAGVVFFTIGALKSL